MLAWLNVAGCQSLVGAPTPLTNAELARHPLVREHVRRTIARWNVEHGASSTRIARVLLLPDSPSIDANEITDKGYINQRLALEHRREAVDALFTQQPDSNIIVIE
jgi:feruloyl-CoA synthase